MKNKTVIVRRRIATGDGTAFVCGNSVYTITFDLDDEWSTDGYRTARFKLDNGEYIDVPFSGTVCEAPIFKDVKTVTIGLYEGDLHTTTGAAFPCVPSILCGTGTHAEPEKDVYNAIMDMMNKLQGADPEQIAEAVNRYLAENPVVLDEKDPTVPDWAKQPEKPKYTAVEVGALPADTPIPNPYTLPVATAATLGGVKPTAATADMTQPVGVDATGALFTAPGASGGASAEEWKTLLDIVTTEETMEISQTFDKVKSIKAFVITPPSGKDNPTYLWVRWRVPGDVDFSQVNMPVHLPNKDLVMSAVVNMDILTSGFARFQFGYGAGTDITRVLTIPNMFNGGAGAFTETAFEPQHMYTSSDTSEITGFDGISFKSYAAGNPFPAGTIVRIIGR